MIRALLFFILFAISTVSRSQSAAPALRPDIVDSTTQVFRYVEQPAHFDGDWGKFLQDHLEFPQAVLEKVYSDTVLAKSGIREKIVLEFIVCEDGGLCNLRVMKGSTHYPELEREAIRVMHLSPAWKPARDKGQPVKVYFTQPILFSTQ